MSRLFVGGLTDDISSKDLRRSFKDFGRLKYGWVADAGGFGFVEYYNHSHASLALTSMDDTYIDGTLIRVEYARPKNNGVDNRKCFICRKTGHLKRDCPRNASVKNPAHWPLNTRPGQRINVGQTLFAKLGGYFKQSIGEPVRVISIEEVCNAEFNEKYQVKKKYLQKKMGNNINEKELFHGTVPGMVNPICIQNFDFRVSGTNATVFGKGSYFATNASYSHNYTTEDSNGIRYMFVANVLLGNYTKGNETMSRPPPLSQGNHELFDSCVNNKYDPSIFIVFERDQCYPKYLISYEVLNDSSDSDSSASSSTSSSASYDSDSSASSSTSSSASSSYSYYD